MLILLQPDLEAAVSFYELFGAFTKKFHLQGKWAELDLNGTSFGLCPRSGPPVDLRTGIVLEVDNLRDLYEDLIDNVQFLNEPVEAIHGLMVSFKDPGGNILDL